MANRKYSVDDKLFDEIDTQDKAYFLGLLYADGCNYKSGLVKIELIQDDLELLEKFKEFLKYDGFIRHYKQGIKIINGLEYYCKDTCRLSFRSKRISRNLEKYGCISNKTYTLKFPTFLLKDDDLLRHFIRGYFDGDGGISYWVNNKNTNHKKFQINFCGTTNIIENIVEIIKNKFNCSPFVSDRYKDRDNNNLQCNICGNRVVENILYWLYKDANIYMQRKYEKYQILINENNRVDKDNKLYGNAFPKKMVINIDTKEIYESCSDAKRKLNIGSTSQVTNRCKKHQGIMYLEEYNNITNKSLIKNNELVYCGMSKKVYCINNNTTYSSITEASNQLGISIYIIQRQCNGFKTRFENLRFRWK